ncbi:MAG TPA: hypothetical protein VF054_00025 [Micromonosporaceae bacterium]
MIVEPRYNGPAESGNGGWTCGLVAEAVGQPADVMLLSPPPIDTPLTVARDGSLIRVYTPDETLVAEAAPTDVGDDAVVPPVDWDDAVAASARYPGFTSHPFPTCFVCGPQRAPGDGLRLFPGRLDDGRTATPWVAPADISPTMMWAALDCPGGWSVGVEARPYVLGRMAARVEAVPAPGEHCVITGRTLEQSGRKAVVASTVYGADRRVLARARAVWVALRVTPGGTPD